MDVFLTGIFASCAVGALIMDLPERFKMLNVWRIVGGMILIYLSFWSLAGSAVGYNDVGQCTHIRTFRGVEGAKCDLGWYYSGWGEATKYPHFITVANSSDKNIKASSTEAPYYVRLSDNWSGKISQTTRFKLPQDKKQFIKLANHFGSPERLLAAVLRPSVNAAMDSVASHHSMENYYTGSQRDKFKADYREAIAKGMKVIIRGSSGQQQPNQLIPHSFQKYGVAVDQAVMHSLQPDSGFTQLIKDRKYAANKRILAREKRLAEEEQRLLMQARQEIEIEKETTEALIEKARRTINAETEKIVGLIESQGELERSEIAKDIAQHQLDRVHVDAEAKRIAAQAQAFERKAFLVADGGLEEKLKTYTTTQQAWAEAFAKRSVPETVFQSGHNEAVTDTNADARTFMEMLATKAAKDLEIAAKAQSETKKTQ